MKCRDECGFGSIMTRLIQVDMLGVSGGVNQMLSWDRETVIMLFTISKTTLKKLLNGIVVVLINYKVECGGRVR